MKKIIVVWVVLFGVVFSGCGKTTGESTKTSPQSSKQKTKTTETTSQSSKQNTKPAVKTSPSKSSTSSEVPQASDNISGVWLATGKQDGVSSTWFFNNGQLTVNYVYHFSYVIAKNKDSHGYTVVTITNKEGKKHALLLKKNGSNFDGRTVEGKAYEKYLTDGTVPNGQIIEFIYQQKQEKVDSHNAYLEEMEHLKKTLRTYIFDKYMPSPDYGYAKGINWSENFYDNLTANEIWNVIEEFKKKHNGEEGTLFEQAFYLSHNAPIKDNWKELFLENWNNSYYKEDKIEKLIDRGDTVEVYTDSLPYTGEKDNYPFVTLDKRTGSWHG
ncbi:hypothetical protein SAMN05444673_3392 [Bacillus sp. OV166]|uniref:hypothetical protein n=1 Tax=Bacillus sp. OV166 TaxID=1882763 RepID=UPI000A2ABD42|nr:hypothetical protein [Bacillus sp. OV166]SMQ78370.1 hypothetical protein SAMN05444673_3392 [Bacillus sp. OV166]